MPDETVSERELWAIEWCIAGAKKDANPWPTSSFDAEAIDLATKLVMRLRNARAALARRDAALLEVAKVAEARAANVRREPTWDKASLWDEMAARIREIVAGEK